MLCTPAISWHPGPRGSQQGQSIAIHVLRYGMAAARSIACLAALQVMQVTSAWLDKPAACCHAGPMTNKCFGCGESVEFEFVCDTCYSAWDQQAEFDYRAIVLGDCTFENMLDEIEFAALPHALPLPF